MNNSILLSIIVPTRNRDAYLRDCLDSLCNINSNSVEFVVHDNSTDKSSLHFENIDSRIRYIHNSSKLSINENFELALDYAKGKYVAFIGDDDGVNINIMAFVEFAHKQGLKAVVGDVSSKFMWSDVKYPIYGSKLSNTLFLRKFTLRYWFPDPKKELLRCAKSSASGFFQLPKAYHGVVEKEMLLKLKEVKNTCFLGPTPDMSSALALGYLLGKGMYVYFDYPLFLPGTAKNSGGGLGVRKLHSWKLEDILWLDKRNKKDWSCYSPRVATGVTIWGECYFQVFNILDNAKIDDFNLHRYNARMFAYNPHFRDVIYANIKDEFNVLDKLLVLSYFLFEYARRSFKLMQNFAKILGVSGLVRVKGLTNIQSAVRVISKIPIEIK